MSIKLSPEVYARLAKENSEEAQTVRDEQESREDTSEDEEEKPGKFECPDCGFIAKNETGLFDHQEKKHPVEKVTNEEE